MPTTEQSVACHEYDDDHDDGDDDVVENDDDDDTILSLCWPELEHYGAECNMP